MVDLFPVWIKDGAQAAGALITSSVTLVVLRRTAVDIRNLHGTRIKQTLALIDEAERRFKRDEANAWRTASFEDSLAKDLLVSRIFGHPITWADWLEIRKFLTDYGLRLDLLSAAGPYRDQSKTPRIAFRLTPWVWVGVICYLWRPRRGRLCFHHGALSGPRVSSS